MGKVKIASTFDPAADFVLFEGDCRDLSKSPIALYSWSSLFHRTTWENLTRSGLPWRNISVNNGG